VVLNTRTDGYELPDDAFVLRGGDLDLDELLESAEKCMIRHGEYGLSVFAADVPRAEDVFTRDPRMARYAYGRYSTAGDIRATGFSMRGTGKAPHWTVTLPDLEVETVERFLEAFVGRVDNPAMAPGG